MAEIAVATHRDQLTEVTNSVHDWWFDIASLRLSENAGRVTVDLMSDADYRTEARKPSRRIVIEGAHSLVVRDSEKVGFYDVNQIEYDDETGTLKILTGVPLVAEVSVSTVSVRVEELET